MHIALGPTDIPHTRRPRARPTPAGRKGSDSLGLKAEYLALHVRERRGNVSRRLPLSFCKSTCNENNRPLFAPRD